MTTSHPNILVPDTRIPLTNPAVVAVMAEGQVVHPLIARIEPLVTAVQGANPDLAIAMWIRFRQIVVEANQMLATETAAIARAAKAGGTRVDPAEIDGVIASLPTHAGLLYNIGRFRAAAFLSSTFDTAQVTVRTPTAVMRQVLHAVDAHHANLLEQLNVLIRAELDAHAEAHGQRVPPGSVEVVLSTAPAQPSTIVVVH